MAENQEKFWSEPLERLGERMNASTNGLTSAEARNRLSQYADARLVPRKKTRWTILLEQFQSPIIILLFASAMLSFLLDDRISDAIMVFVGHKPADAAEVQAEPMTLTTFLIEHFDGVIILFILLASGLLGFWQEWSADDAVAKLLEGIESHTNVVRDGQQVEVPTETVVPGDLIVLNAGALIPADCRIVESHDLFVDEAALTGESYPVEKLAATLPADTVLGQRTNSLFLGTHVVSGMAKALAVNVGRMTEFGRVSERLELQQPETGFERGLRNFGTLLLRVTGVIVVVVLVAKLFLLPSDLTFFPRVVDSLKFALALAVGMTPQLLPAITSVVLAEGAKAMARSHVIVKRLVSIENFGSMTILCSDKTGTLTEGAVRLHSSPNYTGADSDTVFRLAYMNASLQSGFENPIDHAIVAHQTLELPDVRKINEVPYDFQRKRLSVLIDDGGKRSLITKGALSKVLGVCSTIETPAGDVVDIEQNRAAIDDLFNKLSDQGYRVLGVARRDLDSQHATKDDEKQMTFIGCLVFFDPPKTSILETIGELNELGVSLKIITGDNRAVTAAISRQIGLKNARIMTGGEIEHLSDDELAKRALDVDLFAEVEPNQKERIVLSLKRTGNVVGYMGDGINDASALHAADVGISVDTAVDVAREAAQIVLLKQDLKVLVQGVKEGRKTLANTLKYVFVSISGNFGYMFSLAVASIYLPLTGLVSKDFLALLPAQILLVNLLADFPAMALSKDRVDPEAIHRPRRWDMGHICRFMLVFGLSSSMFDFMTFQILLRYFKCTEDQFHSVWFVESVLTGLMMVMILRTQRPFYHSHPGWLLIAAACFTGSITVLLPLMPFHASLGFGYPTFAMMVFAFFVTSMYSVGMEVAKWLFYRRS